MALRSKVALGAALLTCGGVAQQAGTLQPEVHPPLWLQECSASGCDWEEGSVVMDANWRWTNSGGQNCYTDDNTWDPTFCAEGAECARTCSVEGADYKETYGITTTESLARVNLGFVTEGEYSTNFGSRLYVMDSEDTYKLFMLKNREFTFTVDVSKLTCGLNGALYFVEMEQKGDWDGVNNSAGAKYGTGYCDAQCPHDVKFIKGKANVLQWDATHDPPIGQNGACCAEMDIWEANSRATSYTPHPCEKPGLTVCNGVECGDNDKNERYSGICDKDGCDYNNFRMGGPDFYGLGSGFTVDTEKPVTVVTQFITHDGTDTGDLSEIKRFFVQDGKVIENSAATVSGQTLGNSVTDQFCEEQKAAFGDTDDFAKKGGLKTMGEALDRGMVLVLSLWDDSQVNMLWLDSQYPTDVPADTPGVLRGPCPGGSLSKPEYLREEVPTASVTFEKIKVGTFGSTYEVGDGERRRLSEQVV